MYALVVNSFKTTPAVRRILPCAYYHPQASLFQNPQVHSTAKVDQFHVASSYPDDAEVPPTMTRRRTSVHATSQWAETNSTQSEADVKADRGEAANPEELMKYEEPTMDEM
ncbi:uncharacterized protein BDV17DRAFT_93810 [Aspergillus undulatus]|uniref:uncharacterized protein n=1 Tax=Aspergillus undulatus TaxID=1810928 RepID=UPI003CCDEA3F